MAEDVSFENVYMCYIKNMPYIYPPDNQDTMDATSQINTGWHIIPNFLWNHFVTPKQWAEFQIKYEAYHVESCSATIFNMIPMTTQLAIQGTSVFTAFNNTIMALAYTDKLYETSWEKWTSTTIRNQSPNLAEKEGLKCELGTANRKRFELPIYSWKVPHVRLTSINTWADVPVQKSLMDAAGQGVWPKGQNAATWPSGCFWDPMNMPGELQELRPGKNACSFSWSCHPCDSNIWFNMDQLGQWYPWTTPGPYNADNRPFTYVLSSNLDPDPLASRFQNDPWINDYTIPNWAQIPICDPSWFWKEMQQSIADYMGENIYNQKPDLRFPGTEYEKYKWPPTQWFIKMVPLFDTNGTHIEVTAQISMRVKLNVKAKKRRSAYYAPTWGPFNWRSVYAGTTKLQNYKNSFVRYRSAGARKTWQNIANQDTTANKAHPRETPYDLNQKVAGGSGISSTGLAPTTASILTTTAKDIAAKPDLTVTFSSDTLEREVTKHPVAQKRRAQPVTRKPSPDLPINDLTFYPGNIPDTQL
ncbi:capsid protein VP1 [Psittacara leucophthalmus chapparvovirus]|uniref:Capsid protein VP1 n=1 Tax=Psittacara leucophthalmus chapparvovirus TaxID=2604335 RepID=A0A5C0PWM1_9VIRU|nr:capsid protein VP1 [Psittacara leucophthalmus chapparvovirus]QEJ80807.1 capsid protein VP1 [Psittacara leucophthalmus chapparvovirus]